MRSLGFGLENLGIRALERPLIFAAFLVVFTVLFIAFIPSVKFNGNVLSVIPKESQNFKNYVKQKDNFRNFDRDIAIIVKSPRIATASGLEDLRFMQLEMAVTDGIAAAVSVFSLPVPDTITGELVQYFPNTIEDDEHASQLIADLIEKFPQAQSLISREDNAAVLLVSLDLGIDTGNDARVFQAYKEMRDAIEEASPDDFELYFSGLTPIGLTILDTLISDQVRLTLIGLSLGALIAMIFFRSFIAALVCALAPMLVSVWSIGFFGISSTPITYLTTILPTLALILAYADGIVLYHRWNKLNAGIEGEVTQSALLDNLKEAILKIGPASALTSLTTAAALSSFMLSSSEALFQFGWLGIVLVLFAFIAVIIALPLTGLGLIKLGLIKSGRRSQGTHLFRAFAKRSYHFYPRAITLITLAVICGLFYIHSKLEPDYRITDFLPSQSDTQQAESLANEVFGGRSLIFFSMPVVEDGNLSSALNRNRLAEVTEILEERYGEQMIFSLHSFWRNFDEGVRQKIADQLTNLPEESRQGYLSTNNETMLVSLRTPSSVSIAETDVLLDEAKEIIDALPYADEIVITGFPVILAKEFGLMINQLRNSLLLAVFLGIFLVGLATRSVFFAFAAFMPNLLPILLIEAMIYVQKGSINITEVVALTIAFGIAIDNAVHVINAFKHELAMGKTRIDALKDGIKQVAPALGASSVIICISVSATLTSALPLLPAIGTLIIIILMVALFTNLIILPANILTLRSVFKRSST